MTDLPGRSERSLATLTPGTQARIRQITDLPMAKRLLAMGLLPGTVVILVRRGPLSGTCYVKSGSLTLALRAEEAAAIEVA